MKNTPRPTLIGAFVAGAAALAIGAVLVFGSGTFFADKHRFVLFFDRSVKGLNEGASVMFRGVRIGQVTDIKVRLDRKEFVFYIPVLIQIDPGRIETLLVDDTAQNTFSDDVHRLVSTLIDRGLRAQLQTESLLTGQLFVQLDFYSDTPAKLVGAGQKYMEIPTIPSSMEELTRALKDMPLEKLVNRAVHAVEGIDRLVNSPNLKDSLKEIEQAGQRLNALLANIQNEVAPLSDSVRRTADAARETLQQVEKTMSGLSEVTRKDSPLMFELTTALDDLSAAARSIRVMAEYLERHPEALIRGKQ